MSKKSDSYKGAYRVYVREDKVILLHPSEPVRIAPFSVFQPVEFVPAGEQASSQPTDTK